MTDRPILFSAPMVRALLDGRKSMTRRLIKPTSQTDGFTMYPQYLNGERIGSSSDPSFYDLSEFAADPSKGLYGSGTPYCPGDRLWVREEWWAEARYDDRPPRDIPTTAPIYYQTEPETGCAGRYRHGRFMVRWMSRLTLTVTEVRVQRLQHISEEDAVAEGVNLDEVFDGARSCGFPEPRLAFRNLWDSINAKRAPWDSNPWVVALTFTAQRGNIDALAAEIKGGL